MAEFDHFDPSNHPFLGPIFVSHGRLWDILSVMTSTSEVSHFPGPNTRRFVVSFVPVPGGKACIRLVRLIYFNRKTRYTSPILHVNIVHSLHTHLGF